MGAVVEHIIIENDGSYTQSPDMKPFPKPFKEASPEEIIEFLREKGIVGMGGAMFPTYAKIQSAIGKVDCLIVNCAECEPYITTDHRMLLERTHKIIGGTRILLHALGLTEAIIAIEDNKPDAVEAIKNKLGDSTDIRVCVCKTKYPQGDERQMMYAVTGRELPPGKLPSDIGCVLFNCSSCAAVYNAFVHGRPLFRRVITVSGDCVKTPKNLIAVIGTRYRDLIECCGGLIKEPEKLISGGPMMGAAQWDLDTPMIKGTSALLALSYDVCQHYDQPPVCIRCGRCIKNCPMHLMPNYLVRYAMERRYDDCADMGVMSCVECGTCSYNCPGQMMIVQHIRVAKGALRAKNNKK
jgi:electron transport complex protein RnfC